MTRPSSSLLAPSKPTNVFTNLARKMGFGDADTTATTKGSASAKPKESAPVRTKTATPARSVPHRPTVAKHAATKATEKTAEKAAKPEHVATAHPQSRSADTLAPPPVSIPGTAPVASSNSFDSRFSAFR